MRRRFKLRHLEVKGNQLRKVSFLFDPCNSVFWPGAARVSLSGNPILCDCTFFNLVGSAFFYSITGTCGPGNMTRLVFDAHGTMNGIPGDVRYHKESEFGIIAQQTCGPSDLHIWNLTCIQRAYQLSATSNTTQTVTACATVIAFIVFLYEITTIITLL